MYAKSISDPNGFWGEQAKRVDWIKPFTKVKNASYAPGNVSIKWFEDGIAQRRLQLRRPPPRQARRPGRDHLGRRRSRQNDKTITYKELHAEVCRFANVLKARGVKKGDRVTIYYADDPGGGLRDAGLRPHRRRSTRWCSAASRRIRPRPAASKAAKSERGHHRRRRPARRQEGAAQGQCG